MIDVTKSMIREMAECLPSPVKQPSLIIYGDHKAAFVKRMSRKMNKILPDSRLIVISQVHHIANPDNPEEFNNILMQFVKSLTSVKS